MKIFEPEELYDHTVRYDYANERDEVQAYLTEHNVSFKNWNGGIIIVKRENGRYLLPENVNGMGYFEVYWHKDVKKFIDCEPAKEISKRWKTHNEAIMRLTDKYDELVELKETVA